MSVGSQALERSTLEAKDRESLLQIATALGGKPGSRAKKADIITMILELAGVTPASGGEEPEARPPTRRRVARRPEPGDSEQLPLETERASTGGARASGSDEPAEAEAEREPATAGSGNGRMSLNEDRAAVVVSAPDSPGGDRAAVADAEPEGEGRRGGDEAERGEPEPRAGEPRESRAREGGPTRNQHQPTRDDNEQGNRRRRRRGRDRERGGQNQNPAPAAEDSFQGEPVEVAGLLDLRDEGYGFLRVNGYLPSREDVYVSVKQVRQFGLRKGDQIKGAARPASRNEKNPALLRIDEVNGKDPEANKQRPRYEDLTPLFPDHRLVLAGPDEPGDLTARVIDLVAPIGKGQRGLIVSPPKAGKTTILKQIARAIEAHNPEVHLMVLLVDERPEEVTDLRRSVQGEVIASTFDRPADEHTMVAELTIERAKRLVEEGEDVVIILDGITRLARAYNLAAPPTGRVMPGGIDTAAIFPPKRFFGAARNVEEGGSLTILATALVETGSKLDEVVLEEFQGTGNMELRLDRRLAERRTFPAIDVDGSSTQHEEQLFDADQLQSAWKLRRLLADASRDGRTGLEVLVERLSTCASNEELLAQIAEAPTEA